MNVESSSYSSESAAWIRSCCWSVWTGSSGRSGPAPGRAAGRSAGSGRRTAAPAPCRPHSRWKAPIGAAPRWSSLGCCLREESHLVLPLLLNRTHRNNRAELLEVSQGETHTVTLVYFILTRSTGLRPKHTNYEASMGSDSFKNNNHTDDWYCNVNVQVNVISP